MIKFIKANKKKIIISLTISIAIAYLLGYSRTYPAFGGEDLIPFITLFYWVLKYTDKQEKKNDSTFQRKI